MSNTINTINVRLASSSRVVTLQDVNTQEMGSRSRQPEVLVLRGLRSENTPVVAPQTRESLGIASPQLNQFSPSIAQRVALSDVFGGVTISSSETTVSLSVEFGDTVLLDRSRLTSESWDRGIQRLHHDIENDVLDWNSLKELFSDSLIIIPLRSNSPGLLDNDDQVIRLGQSPLDIQEGVEIAVQGAFEDGLSEAERMARLEDVTRRLADSSPFMREVWAERINEILIGVGVSAGAIGGAAGIYSILCGGAAPAASTSIAVKGVLGIKAGTGIAAGAAEAGALGGAEAGSGLLFGLSAPALIGIAIGTIYIGKGIWNIRRDWDWIKKDGVFKGIARALYTLLISPLVDVYECVEYMLLKRELGKIKQRLTDFFDESREKPRLPKWFSDIVVQQELECLDGVFNELLALEIPAKYHDLFEEKIYLEIPILSLKRVYSQRLHKKNGQDTSGRYAIARDEILERLNTNRQITGDLSGHTNDTTKNILGNLIESLGISPDTKQLLKRKWGSQ